jgi:hypothetical protein
MALPKGFASMAGAQAVMVTEDCVVTSGVGGGRVCDFGRGSRVDGHGYRGGRRSPVRGRR